MKPQELKELINIRIEPSPAGYRHTIVEGRITFIQSYCIDQGVPNHSEAVEMAKETIKESLCRRILGDRYTEFMDALQEIEGNSFAFSGRIQERHDAFKKMRKLIDTLKD